jgi:cell division protein FtsQ
VIAGDSSAALLGLAVMTMFGKRGSAVLDVPEEGYALETDWTIPQPAPPGTLHHGYEAASAPIATPFDEPESRPQQPGRYRLRVGVPGTMAGRVAMGAAIAFILGVLLSSFLAVRYSALHDDRFFLRSGSNIEIEGRLHLTKEQIADVFKADLRRNIFNVPLADRQADIERLPWTEHATVMRLLPDRIRVQVAERTPVAFVRQGTQIGLIDSNGVLLDMPQDDAGNPHYSFPVLTGISTKDPISTRVARMGIYRQFMLDLDSSGEKFTQNLSEVDVSDPEDVKALITSGSTDILVHFGEENFLQRYRLFEQNLPQWKTQYPKLAAVDTRYEHQLVLEMAAGTNAPLPEAKVSAVEPETKPAAKHTVVTSEKATAHKLTPSHSATPHGPVKR